MPGWSMGVNGEELRALWAPDPDGPEPEKCPEMDWDLIYKPLKYFWFARQEIGSRHPLNVCVCVCGVGGSGETERERLRMPL